jgi:LysM repeat protein
VYAKNYHSEKKSSYHSVVREAIGPFKPVSNYIVRPGDSLYKIARKNHISVNCLIKYNDIGKSKLLRVKQRLHIPRWQQCIGK